MLKERERRSWQGEARQAALLTGYYQLSEHAIQSSLVRLEMHSTPYIGALEGLGARVKKEWVAGRGPLCEGGWPYSNLMGW